MVTVKADTRTNIISTGLMRLSHLHLPHPIPYAHSLRLQEVLLQRHYAYNSYVLQNSKSASVTSKTHSPPEQPLPTLLTFQSQPVYTVGRRHLTSNPLSQSQIDFLTTNASLSESRSSSDVTRLATFFPSPRGGLLTYHAPGQLTAYLIINLRHHGITPRCFIRLLENTVIRTCAKHGVRNALTTEDPGVWIGETVNGLHEVQVDGETCGGNVNLRSTDRKICAIGVHVTRGITSHGIGLNVCDAPIQPPEANEFYTIPSKSNDFRTPAAGYLSWGFGRIVACGLEGKSVTWLTDEGADVQTKPDEVATTLAEEVCKSLTKQGKVEVNGIDSVCEEDIL